MLTTALAEEGGETCMAQKGRKRSVHRSASEMAEGRGRKRRGIRTFTRTSPERLEDGSDSDDSLYSGHRDSGVVSEHQSENVPSFSDIVPEVFEKKEPVKSPPKIGPENPRKEGRPDKTKVEKLKEDAKRATIRQHYYPEGGWGWVVAVAGTCSYFFVESTAMLVGLILFEHLPPKLGKSKPPELKGWLGSLSLAVPLLLSPLTIALCRRKSTRLAAVLGGLIAALGCLFSSFASQFPQLFLSYGMIFGAGVGLTRDTATLMVGQYFKRRRELVEIVLMSGTGVGMAVMAAVIQGTLSSIGWRLGLQVVTCIILLSSLFGCCYRSASLYHPQRRAILHLKNQRRKIKDKTKIDDKPPLFDFSTLRSKTIRILLVSTGISYLGILAPLVLLVREVEKNSPTHLQSQLLFIHLMMGMAWVLGCATTGLLIIKKPKNFLIGRQYITQISSMVAGIAILSLGSHEGNSPQSFQMFSFVYGFSTGAYSYALKLYVYEKVRARNFSRAWSFVQFAQGVPLMIGIPFSGFLNEYFTSLLGFYVSGSAVCLGSFLMFLIDVRKYLITRKNKRAHRHKHHHVKTSESTHSRLKFAGPDSEAAIGAEEVFEEGRCTPSCKESIRRDSFADEDDLMAPLAIINQTSLAALGGQFGDPLVPELTCISEEGIADMDIPDHLFEEFEFEMNIGPDDEISSCDKVENCLMLSEYENNLIKHNESSQASGERKSRRWSIFKLGPRDHRSFRNNSFRNGSAKILDPYNQRREIDIIEEASI